MRISVFPPFSGLALGLEMGSLGDFSPELLRAQDCPAQGSSGGCKWDMGMQRWPWGDIQEPHTPPQSPPWCCPPGHKWKKILILNNLCCWKCIRGRWGGPGGDFGLHQPRGSSRLGASPQPVWGKCSLQLSSPSVGIFSIKFPEMLASWAGGAERG